MSTNLHLSTRGKNNKSFPLVQTPTRVTHAAKPELNNRTFTRDVYAAFVRQEVWSDDPETAEEHLALLDAFLAENPSARFEGW